MEPENLTVRVLMDIRDEMRGMRAELVEVKGEIVQMKGEIVEMKGEIVHVNERLGAVEHVLVDVATQVRFLGRAAGVSRVARRRHAKRLDELERRVDDLERKRT